MIVLSQHGISPLTPLLTEPTGRRKHCSAPGAISGTLGEILDAFLWACIPSRVAGEHTMTRRLLAVLLGVVIAGCASLGVHTEGTSGPIAWHVTDLRSASTPGQRGTFGDSRGTYALTLVLKETQGIPITFTYRKDTLYASDITVLKPVDQEINLQLRAHEERYIPLTFSWNCASVDCLRLENVAPRWTIHLTGTDDKGKPVQAVINMHLPPAPPVAETSQSPKPYAVTLTTGLTDDKKPINELTEISMQEKRIYIFVQWHLPTTEHNYSSKLFDGSGRLLREWHSKFTPPQTLWNTWSFYNIKRGTDQPGQWKFEIYLDGEKMVEQYLTVLPQ